MGWRSRRLGPWPFQSKLGLAPSNRCHANGTHDSEVRRLGKKDRRMANDPHDSRRKDKLIMGRCIPINIHMGENEVRREVYSKVINEGKQKASTRLSNGIIVR